MDAALAGAGGAVPDAAVVALGEGFETEFWRWEDGGPAAYSSTCRGGRRGGGWCPPTARAQPGRGGFRGGGRMDRQARPGGRPVIITAQGECLL